MADAATPTIYRPERPAVSTKALWWLTLGAFALLYLATCQRGVSWQDSGRFQWRVLMGQYHDSLGLALAHPLYIAAGRVLASISETHLPFLLNFFSGLGMAVALANLAAVSAILSGRWWIGLATAAMLGVTHTVWWLSTIAEVYTWSAAGLTAELWLLVILLRRPRWQVLAALAIVSGLGLSLHNFALLPLPVYLVAAIVLVIRKRLPAWSLAVGAGAFTAGAGPYLSMVLEQAWRTGDWIGTGRSALFGGDYADDVLNVTGTSKHLPANAGLAALNFASLLMPLAIIGWIRFRRALGSAVATALGAITIIEIVFVVRYSVPDQFTFLLPSLVMTALAGGIGLAFLADHGRGWKVTAVIAASVSIAAPPAVYALAPRLLDCAHIDVARQRHLPFRDEERYWLLPWKHNEDSAERFSASALAQAAPDGVILPDTTSTWPLVVSQLVNGLAPEVTVQVQGRPLGRYDGPGGTFRTRLGDRQLYVVAPIAGHVPDGLLADAEFDRSNDRELYRVRWK